MLGARRYAPLHSVTGLSSEQLEDVVLETQLAFASNVAVYAEEGSLYIDSVRGAANITTGFVSSRFG